MNFIPTFVLAFIMLVFVLDSSAQQCTTCDIIISGASSAPMTLNSGDTLCITSTGNFTGTLTTLGGFICNEGILNPSFFLLDNNSFLLNHATFISTFDINLSNGTIINNGTANFPNGYNGGLFINNGTLIGTGASIFFGGTKMINNGVINADGLVINADTLFNNTGAQITLNGNFFNNSGVLINKSCMELSGDMTNNANSFNKPNATILVGRDFVNSFGLFVNESCIRIDRDMTNHAILDGAVSSCSQMTVSGQSINNATFNPSGFMDFCDVGAPPGGFDFQFGTIGSNTTFCTCGACTFANCDLLLDQDLLFFEVKKMTKKQVLCKWKLKEFSSKIKNFTIFRSENGIDFTAVYSKETHNLSEREFSYIDQPPYSQTVFYYKLVTTYFGENKVVSSTYAVEFNNKEVSTIFPIPAQNLIFINYNYKKASGIINLIIYSIDGQEIKTFSKPVNKGYNLIHLPIEFLSDGMYILECSTDRIKKEYYWFSKKS
ncbi:MAG: T9SS type A sorting domain-containing protein [Aureispira sp.]|nr:T9SS type A sorting domain-containing protein [Aureispira sp.]